MFPAYAGVFRSTNFRNRRNISVPRIRGGVPNTTFCKTWDFQCSPHTRGCSFDMCLVDEEIFVFPAYAGVFLDQFKPHGYVSKCSPHTRGCSPFIPDKTICSYVFPAYAGVFLAILCKASKPCRVPRIRGGVPHLLPALSSQPECSPHTRGCSVF